MAVCLRNYVRLRWHCEFDYMNISHVYFDNAIALALVDGVSPDFTTAGFAE
jgi:hypothetical protein